MPKLLLFYLGQGYEGNWARHKGDKVVKIKVDRPVLQITDIVLQKYCTLCTLQVLFLFLHNRDKLPQALAVKFQY